MRILLALAFALSFPAAAQPPHDDGVPAAIRSQNIMDVKPEVKRDASSEPGYMQQDNGQRNAVQPGNNSPMWRAVAAGAEGATTLPADQAPEAGVLIQRPVQYLGARYTTAGEAWRQVRNNRLVPYGGALFLIVLGAIALFHFTKGPIGRHRAEEGGARIERFTPFERSAHWANAIAFCVLAVSGLVMAFGRFLLLPVLGAQLFGWLTHALKTLHNFAGPVFAVSLAIVFLTFLRHNWPQRGDLKWLLKGGGMFDRSSGHEPPSHRFNAGEKLVFWAGVTMLGAMVVASGLVMDKLLPGVTYDRGTMQVAHMVHNAAAILMMCVFAGHIYIGTIGMRGAYAAMRRGWVGDAWAKEHHAYWHEDIRAGKVPARRSKEADPRTPDRIHAAPR
jgi:formate dehydrogenase subunit gamma